MFRKIKIFRNYSWVVPTLLFLSFLFSSVVYHYREYALVAEFKESIFGFDQSLGGLIYFRSRIWVCVK